GQPPITSSTRDVSKDPWILPDVTSPVFLRFFDQKLIWIEAEKVCQNHLGHLVADGNGNEAFLRDFLSALDISNEIWIGPYQDFPIARSQGSDDLTSTFEAAPNFMDERTPIRSTLSVRPDWNDEENDLNKMCVSINPSSGYRWNTRFCNGPDRAMFPPTSQPESPLSFSSSTKPGPSLGGDGSDPSDLLHPVFQDISYFPHNDSVQVSFQCRSNNGRTNGTIRVRTCSLEGTLASVKSRVDYPHEPSLFALRARSSSLQRSKSGTDSSFASLLCANEEAVTPKTSDQDQDPESIATQGRVRLKRDDDSATAKNVPFKTETPSSSGLSSILQPKHPNIWTKVGIRLPERSEDAKWKSLLDQTRNTQSIPLSSSAERPSTSKEEQKLQRPRRGQPPISEVFRNGNSATRQGRFLKFLPKNKANKTRPLT
ncbi:hypothetical protein TCAL_15798, partial [Tigriopus californicus]